MDDPTTASEQRHAELVTRLVDGAPDQRSAATPEVEREVARQRRVVSELRAGAPPAPEELLRAVQERVHGSGRRSAPDATRRPAPDAARRRPSAPARRRGAGGWPRLAIAAAAIVPLVAVAAGLLLIGLGAGGPSIAAAAELAYKPATAPAPPPRNARYLDVTYAGITYPNYVPPFGVPADGQRHDRVGGRPALTVFYRLRDGTRLSYTVFSGRPVALPPGTRRVIFDGVPLDVFTHDGLSVVTLVRFGRTCVLAAPAPKATVLALAAQPIHVQP